MAKPRERKVFVIHRGITEMGENIQNILQEFPYFDIVSFTQSITENNLMVGTLIIQESKYLP
jgi:hypothetical protein